MAVRPDHGFIPASSPVLSNAEIADRLASLAQLLSSQKENPYKIKAYQRAAARIRNLSESLDEMVRDQEDLTRFAGIGEAIASAIREIVTTGTLGKLDRAVSRVEFRVAAQHETPGLGFDLALQTRALGPFRRNLDRNERDRAEQKQRRPETA